MAEGTGLTLIATLQGPLARVSIAQLRAKTRSTEMIRGFVSVVPLELRADTPSIPSIHFGR